MSGEPNDWRNTRTPDEAAAETREPPEANRSEPSEQPTQEGETAP